MARRPMRLTADQEKYVRKHYKTKLYREIATDLGISFPRLKNQIRAMGIQKEILEKEAKLGEWFDWNEFVKTDVTYFDSGYRRKL